MIFLFKTHYTGHTMNFDGIYNYYERMVYEEIMGVLSAQDTAYKMDDAEDIACLALNTLPAKYVRHSVDTAFFLAEGLRVEMQKAVQLAVKKALHRVKSHPGVKD